MTNVAAIKKYFGDTEPHNRPVTMQELKALTAEDRKELGAMCAKELGVEITAA